MTKYYEMFDAAVEAYAGYLGVAGAAEIVANEMKEQFDLSDADAKALAQAAYKEWVEAYTD